MFRPVPRTVRVTLWVTAGGRADDDKDDKQDPGEPEHENVTKLRRGRSFEREDPYNKKSDEPPVRRGAGDSDKGSGESKKGSSSSEGSSSSAGWE